MANKDYASISLQPSGSNTKLRVEQIKSEDGFNSLAIDLEALRGQVKDIIGGADYKEEITGDYAKVQLVDLKQHIDASSATELSIKLATAMTGAVQMNSTLNVDGEATLASATVEDILATQIVFAGAGGSLTGSYGVVWDGNDLVAASAKVSDLVSTQIVVAGTNGALSGSGALVYDGSDLIVGSAKVSDLTATRVVYAGADGALVDNAEMTFASGVLTVSGSTFSKDVTIAGNLIVQGDTITANVGELVIEDKNVVIGKDTGLSLLSDSGLYVSSSASAHSLLWQYNGGSGAEYWDMSDELRVPDLRIENIVSAPFLKTDAEGDVVAATVVDFGSMLDTQLVAGTGVTLSAADVGGFVTASIGQDVATTSAVTFAAVTGSNLTASRLMASNADKVMVSVASLSTWITGTLNQVNVADDGDGTMTLSLPQSIDTAASVQFGKIFLDGNGASDAFIDTDGSDMLVLGYRDSAGTGVVSLPVAQSGSYTLSGFTATSIVGALNELKSAASSALPSKETWVVSGSPYLAGSNIGMEFDETLMGSLTANNSLIFVNGQLMTGGGADYTLTTSPSVSLEFTFDTALGDVVTVQRV